MTEREFEYKDSLVGLLVGAVATLGIGSVFLYWAITGYGLRIRSLKLTPEVSTIVFWVVGIALLGYFVYTLFAIYRRFKIEQKIGLTSTSITVPVSSWSSEHVTVAFSDVSEARPFEEDDERKLAITYSKGTFTVEEDRLPNTKDFDTILAAIQDGAEAVRSGGGE